MGHFIERAVVSLREIKFTEVREIVAEWEIPYKRIRYDSRVVDLPDTARVVDSSPCP